MSVFKSIKGTFQNVQHDISESFKSLRTKEKEIERKRVRSHGNDVIFDAGADLLNSFQQSWVEIHRDSEYNSQMAQSIDKKASYIYLSCEHQNDSLNQLLLEVSTLPPLLDDITNLMENIGALQAAFYEVEELLVDLENICEIQEMHQNQEHHCYKLAMYSQRKNTQIEHIKVKFAQDHAKKVQQFETQNRARLKQKQKALDQRFKEDLKNYQMFGKPPGRTSSGESRKQIALGDIQPEETSGELNEFLGDVNDMNQDDDESEVQPADNADDALQVFEDDEEQNIRGSIVIKTDEDLPDEDGNVTEAQVKDDQGQGHNNIPNSVSDEKQSEGETETDDQELSAQNKQTDSSHASANPGTAETPGGDNTNHTRAEQDKATVDNR